MATRPDELLEHEADGIREFDNQLPRWWLYGFYFTIVFGVVYFVNYHVLSTPFFGRPSLVAEYEAEVDAARALAPARPPAGDHGAVPAAAVEPLTDAASLAKGEAIFTSASSLCATCHRADLGGMVGPNLTDDMWLHGCTPAEIMQNVTTGFPAQGMLPFGSTQALDAEQLLQLVSYIVSKRGSNPPSPKAADPARDKPCVTGSK